MRQILWTLIVLAFTQGVYGMEHYSEPLEVERIKGQLSTFDRTPLKAQQTLLIDALNGMRQVKKKAQFFTCQRLKEEVIEYEGFNQITNSFTLNTSLEFSGKTLSVKDIDPEEMKLLIYYLIYKTTVLHLKARLLEEVRAVPSMIGNTDNAKNNRHDLLWYTYQCRGGCNEFKTSLSLACLPLIGDETILECRIPYKTSISNRRREMRLAFKASALSTPTCYKKTLIQNQNEFCNDTCALKKFVDFSTEDLFDFYKTTLIKYNQRPPAKESRWYEVSLKASLMRINPAHPIL